MPGQQASIRRKHVLYTTRSTVLVVVAKWMGAVESGQLEDEFWLDRQQVGLLILVHLEEGGHIGFVQRVSLLSGLLLVVKIHEQKHILLFVDVNAHKHTLG